MAGLLGCTLLGVPGLAVAQDGFGIRAGGTVDPDQGFVGLHYVAAISEGSKLHPAAEVGFGNNLVMGAFHIDFAQWFELGSGEWSVFVGGGTAINVYRFDTPQPGEHGELVRTEVEGGLDALVGFASKKGLMLEVRVGTNGSPDLRFTVGFTF